MRYIFSFILKASTNFLNNMSINDKLPVLLHSQRQCVEHGLEGKTVYSWLKKKTETAKNSQTREAMLVFEEQSPYNSQKHSQHLWGLLSNTVLIWPGLGDCRKAFILQSETSLICSVTCAQRLDQWNLFFSLCLFKWGHLCTLKIWKRTFILTGWWNCSNLPPTKVIFAFISLFNTFLLPLRTM